MKGWFEWHKFTKESNKAARDYFNNALSAEPSYASAYTGLAWTYSSDYDFEWTDDFPKTLSLALEAAQNAVRMDGADYKGHWVLGWAQLYSRQQDKALASYQQARKLNKFDADLLAEMANVLIYTNQPDQAVKQIEEAIRLNPFHDTWYLEYLGWAYEEAGKPAEAIATLEPILQPEASEEQQWVLPFLAAAYADPKVGKPDEAHKVVRKFSILTHLSRLLARWTRPHIKPRKVPIGTQVLCVWQVCPNEGAYPVSSYERFNRARQGLGFGSSPPTIDHSRSFSQGSYRLVPQRRAEGAGCSGTGLSSCRDRRY